MILLNPAGQLILAVTITALIIILLLKGRVKLTLNRQSDSLPGVHTTTRTIRTTVKLARHPGAKTAFPKLRVMSSGPTPAKLDRVEVKGVRDDGREFRADAGVSAGTPITPDPGTEIDLASAFQQIARELCDPFASKTRIKYSVSIQQSVEGRVIPMETPLVTADLWPDGLEDIMAA